MSKTFIVDGFGPGIPRRSRSSSRTCDPSSGPVSVLHWSAHAGIAGDFLSAKPAEIRSLLDLPIVGLVASLQAALPDLRGKKESALLVTGTEACG
jgi:NADP-dependent 3-hydroxy acid dehydrogenase YdfG